MPWSDWQQLEGAGVPLRRRLPVRLILIIAVSMTPVIALAIAQAWMRYQVQVADARQILTQQARTVFETGADVFTSAEPVLAALASQEAVATGSPACSSALQNALIGLETYTNLTRIDAGGQILCAALPLPENRDITRFGWWEETRGSERLAVMPAVFGGMSKQTIMLAVLPLRSEQGVFEGAMVASISVGWLQELLRSARIDRNSVLAVFDRDGALVAASDFLKASQIFDDRSPQASGKSLLPIQDRAGNSWVYQTAPLLEQDVTVGYAVPESEVLGWTYVDIVLNLLLPLLAAFAAMGAIWWATNRQILRWLDYLRRIAGAYAGGKYSVRPQRAYKAP